MHVRADQLHVGDRLRAGQVVWLLPTPDRSYVVVGLQSRRPKSDTTSVRVTRRYRRDQPVTVLYNGDQ